MSSNKNSKGKKLGAGLLMGLLALSLLGFGVEGFGTARQTIGTVGERDITADDYARTLQNDMRALQAQIGETVTLEQARLFGLDQRALQQLIDQAALDTEAERFGVSVGDATVQAEILGISSFQGIDGSFDREAYRFALQNAGLSEGEFETSIREEIARSILQLATVGGASAPEGLVQPLLDYQAQTRDFTVLTLTADDLDSPVGQPDDAALTAYYDANLDRYTQPAGKRLDYAWITPEMLLDTLDADEEELRAAYEARAAQYRQPERRLVERLILPDMSAAQTAMDRIRAGEATFEDVVADRGLTLDDTDMGDVTRDALGDAAEAVFALEEPGVTGPVETDLGPAIFRMNAILAARETPFEEARAELRDALLMDRARRILAENLDLYEDLLAGGATVTQLAAETEMQEGQIDWRPDVRSGIAAYEEFRDAARDVQAGDFAEILLLDDGGMFALELVEGLPATPRPLDDIRTQVVQDWQSDEIRARLSTLAEALMEEVEGGTAIDALGLDSLRFADLSRSDPVPDLPGAVLEQAFELDEGALATVADGARVHVVQLHAVNAPDPDMDSTQQIRRALDQQITQSYAQDLFGYFGDALRQSMPVTLNQQMIDAVEQSF
ncbi:MAG: peptidyl-prolyl cis-trans isomerase PpiD [Roseibaca calidilacus]|uniref:Parvulin-like PPIase n=1 Tax=Roseibaca calidilacus TaxID=1666912 RepID=A0A0P7WHJ6_9RHOB|nr:peptidylprolyl isomerase [Roseibaca calidilacus]KPP89971.1 MAG: peptidyl-prolyl cis-trans isomerase PpiD [Roseibaca calidilacus]CUX81073.1 peptidyl-prolyl cis-trans isomerase D [Roseibaca calidilacus]